MKWIKIILLCCVVSIISCRKLEIEPTPQPSKNIFEKSDVSVVDGQDIEFNLSANGKYIMVIYDSTTQQVISKEKFTGIVGNNTKKIYTKTLPNKTLNLYLSDENNNQLNKTRIIINN
jgi:hypothetical protein